MTANTADNFYQQPHNGVYGNKSIIEGKYANLATATAVAGDTFDLARIPGGATLLSVTLYSSQCTGTSTYACGIRYADGTSTGGTTGTAIFMKTTATAVASLIDHGITATMVQSTLKAKPFTNDVDTVLYLTFASGPSHSANDDLSAVAEYVATGTK